MNKNLTNNNFNSSQYELCNNFNNEVKKLQDFIESNIQELDFHSRLNHLENYRLIQIIKQFSEDFIRKDTSRDLYSLSYIDFCEVVKSNIQSYLDENTNF